MRLRRAAPMPDEWRRGLRLGLAVLLLSSLGFTLIDRPGYESAVMTLKWACLTLPVVTMPLLGKVSGRLLACPGPASPSLPLPCACPWLTRLPLAHTPALLLPLAHMRPILNCVADRASGLRAHARHHPGRRPGLPVRWHHHQLVDAGGCCAGREGGQHGPAPPSPCPACRCRAKTQSNMLCRPPTVCTPNLSASYPPHPAPPPPCARRAQHGADTHDLAIASLAACFALLSVLAGKRFNLDLSARLFVIAFLLVAFSSQQGQGGRPGCACICEHRHACCLHMGPLLPACKASLLRLLPFMPCRPPPGGHHPGRRHLPGSADNGCDVHPGASALREHRGAADVSEALQRGRG